MVENLRVALDLRGDTDRGRRIFEERCASCHRLGGQGHPVGPDLVSARNAGKDKMLINMVDPSRELLPQYIAYEVETVDGESLPGLLSEETATHVTLRQDYATETRLQRSDIVSMTSRRKSLMPDGLESGLKPQELADLFEFLFAAP